MKLKRWVRKVTGFVIGLVFIVSGARKRALRAYDQSTAILSLMSHNPSRKVFSEIVKWLKVEGFHFISTDEMLSGEFGELRRKYRRLAWLTLDDAWQDCIDNVLPVLHAENIPVTFFIAPCELERGYLSRIAINGRATPDELATLVKMPVADRYAFFDRKLRGRQPLRELMSLTDVSTLAKDPLVTFENHTSAHEACAHQDEGLLLPSIISANEKIYELTGRKPRMMCYPYGIYTEENDRLITEKIGLIPVTLDPGVMTTQSIGRFRNQFYDDMSFAENSCRVVGSWLRIKSMKVV